MSTTSGQSSATTLEASVPSPTDATTLISARRPRISSSASRKTSLSSTSTTRICSVTELTLFGKQEQLVMRLATVVEVDLELGVLFLELFDEAVQLGRALSGEQREHLPWLEEQALGDHRRNLGEARPARDRAAVEQA